MNTKLSEAIMLGIGTVEHMIAGNMNACAFGIALNAMGVPQLVDPMQNDARYSAVDTLWPWTKDNATNWPIGGCHMISWQSTIWATFDLKVMFDKTMTIEQLADWVRSVEPECRECNQFQCTCKLVTHEEEALEHASR